MTLTLKDRVLLANQYRILKVLQPGEEKYYDEVVEVLESGYTLEYHKVSNHFSEEFSVEDCREVMEILDMHRMLKNAYRSIEDKSGIDVAELGFKGFDSNEETKQHAYTHFLIHVQGRWAESKKDDLDTHIPMLDHYRRMLRAWDGSPNKHKLTRDDVLRILAV